MKMTRETLYETHRYLTRNFRISRTARDEKTMKELNKIRIKMTRLKKRQQRFKYSRYQFKPFDWVWNNLNKRLDPLGKRHGEIVRDFLEKTKNEDD